MSRFLDCPCERFVRDSGSSTKNCYLLEWWVKLATVCDGSKWRILMSLRMLIKQNVVDSVTKFEPRPSRVVNRVGKCFSVVKMRCLGFLNCLTWSVCVLAGDQSVAARPNIEFLPQWDWTPCGRWWLCGVWWQLWQLPPRLWRGIYSPSLGSQQVSWESDLELQNPKPLWC